MQLFEKVDELNRTVDKLGAVVTFGLAETRKDISENANALKNIETKIDAIIKAPMRNVKLTTLNRALTGEEMEELLSAMRKEYAANQKIRDLYPCQHDTCEKQPGSDLHICMLSCSCPKCTPRY